MRALLLLGYGLWAALGAREEPILGPIAAVFLWEFSFVSFRAAKIMGGVVSDEAVAARVGPVLTELCRRAGCAIPQVILRDDFVRTAGVRRVGGQVTIVLSRPFVERLSDQQLPALLAHEVIHIARRDLDAVRGRRNVVMLGGVALALGAAVAAGTSRLVVIPIVTSAFLAGLWILNFVLSPLNRSKERRADLEGAQLSGDPLALAQALAVVEAIAQEMRLRLYGRGPWRWLLSPVSWRLPTHPPMASRIARLEALAQP